MHKDDAGDPFEPGDPLKDENFGKYWLTYFLIALVLLLFIVAFFLLWLNHHATHWQPA